MADTGTGYEPFVIDMDMNEVPEWDGSQRPLLPIGRYKLRVIKVTQKQNQMIEVQYQVVDGSLAGQFVWNNYNYGNDTGMKRLKHLMVQCGASLAQFDSNELMGAEIYADVVHEAGKARPDATGAPQEPKMFANVVRERSAAAEEAELAQSSEAEPQDKPPIMRGNTAPPAAQPAAQPAATANTGNRRQTSRRT